MKLLLVLGFASAAAASQCPDCTAAALDGLIQATNVAEKWNGWSEFAQHRDPRKLEGVTVDADGHVTKIELYSGLTGSIPESLGELTNLEYLRLDNNELTGSIPASLGELVKLESLFLHGNQLTGTIPESIGKLTKLTYLSLSTNQLTGSIPESLGKLVKLVFLHLGKNQLTGSIPESLGKLVNLETLYLWQNQLTGSIPESLGALVKLEKLYLYGNQLSGSIPASLGRLLNLELLRLESNQLTGSMPQKCPTGTGWNWGSQQNKTCQACDSGTYSATSNYAACQPYTDCNALGMVVETAGTATADAKCGAKLACAANKFVTNNVCTGCPSGHTCDGTGAKPCAADKFVTNNVCTGCPSGHTCDGTDATPCATTKFVTNNVCTVCPLGHTCDGTDATAPTAAPTPVTSGLSYRGADTDANNTVRVGVPPAVFLCMMLLLDFVVN